jgi:uncharacterized protein YbjT (DUF2867 family)
MNITVFGASGGIGSRVVTLAAPRGHQVRAVYRQAPRSEPAQLALRGGCELADLGEVAVGVAQVAADLGAAVGGRGEDDCRLVPVGPASVVMTIQLLASATMAGRVIATGSPPSTSV